MNQQTSFTGRYSASRPDEVNNQPPPEHHDEPRSYPTLAGERTGGRAAFKHWSNLTREQTFRDSFKPQSAESKRPAAAGFIGELHAAGGEGELHGESLR